MDSAPLAIFLSPHFDDIALSCGGMAARLSRSGARCFGVTVCAAPAAPGEGLSDYAKRQHEKWGDEEGSEPRTINEVRREEERQALGLLGLEPVWLDVPDAPYRHSAEGEYFYASDETLMGAVALEERRVLVPKVANGIRHIAGEYAARGRVRVFAPLGIGHHVDHQLVFSAARRLGPRYGVLFYEDYPYASRPGKLQARLEELTLPVQPRLTPISDLIGVKIAAIARYKSQLPMLFGSSEAMPAAVRAYFEAVGGAPGHYAERFWYIPPIYTVRV